MPGFELELVADLQGHDERAWHVAWNPTKPLIASCSADKSVRLYNYQSNDGNVNFSHTATINTGHSKTVRSIAWSPSGKTLATASFDSNIGIWEQEADEEDSEGITTKGEWECASLLEGHETECKSVDYSASGTLLASCSRDKTVWVWEVHPDSDFECMGVLMEHTQDVKSVAWHPREEILASASYDDTIKLYIDDPSDDWFCFSTLTGHTSSVWSLAWSPDGQFLASGSEDRSIRIWRRTAEHKWEHATTLTGHERSVYSISWGKGRAGTLGWIASTGGDGVLIIWELEESATTPVPNHKIVTQMTSAHGVFDVNSVAWCPRDGYENLLSTAGDDGSAKIWKIFPTMSE